MAFSWIFIDPILRIFGTTEAILPLARTYIGIITIGFMFQIVSMAVANSLRSQNRPRSAMFATVSGTALNAILATLFMSIGKAAQGGGLYILRQALMIAGMALLPGLMGIEGVFWAGPLTDLICVATSAIILFVGIRNLRPADTTEPDGGTTALEGTVVA